MVIYCGNLDPFVTFSCTQEKPFHRLIKMHEEKMRPDGRILAYMSL